MSWAQALRVACTAGCLALPACSGDPRLAGTTVFESQLPISENAPGVWQSELSAGAYRIDAREIGIEFKMTIETAGQTSHFDDEVARHGYQATVVVMRDPGVVRIQLHNAEFRDWRGSAALRVVRLRDIEDTPDALERGLAAFGEGCALLARPTFAERETAVASFRQAIDHFTTAGDIAARADAHYALASIEYMVRMDNQAAIAPAGFAQADFSAVGNAVGVHDAIALRAMADIEIAWKMNAAQKRAEQQELYRSAEERLVLAEAFFDSRGLILRRDFALNVRGIGVLYSGDYVRAVPIFEEAIRRAIAIGDTRERLKRVSNLSWTHNRLGLFEKSARAIEEVIHFTERERDARLYAYMRGNYGLSAVAIGEFDSALTAQAEAHSIFLENGMRAEAANALSSIAGIYLRLGDTERAIKTYELAIADFEVSRDFSALASAARLAGSAAGSLGRHDEALAYFRRALAIDGKPVDIARTHLLIARALRETGDLRGAARELAQAMTTDNPLLRATVHDERGRLRLARGQRALAIADFHQADAGFVALGADVPRIETNAALSGALLAGGDVAMAIEAADRAIQLESRIRLKSANPEWRASLLSMSYAPYEARIAAELAGNRRGLDHAWRAFLIAERVRARAIADRLAVSDSNAGERNREVETLRAKLTAQLGRLETRLQSQGPDDAAAIEMRRVAEITRAELVSLAATHPAWASPLALPSSRADVQSMLPPDVVVLAFFTGDQATDVWMLTRDDFRHVRAPGAAALEARVTAFVTELRSSPGSDAGSVLGAALLHGLMDGVVAKRLVILADGPLNALPFAALPMPRSKELLVDRFAISMSPSLALALQNPRRAAMSPTRVVVVSDPVYSLADRRLTRSGEEKASPLRGDSLTRLPYSGIEARAVSSAFVGVETIHLTGFDAIPAKVLDLDDAPLRVLHFATHARSSGAAEDSALFLSRFAADGSRISANALTADDVTQSNLRADLVVLSGCSTGEGRELRGGGVLGLTHGFLSNGTRSVIASLWPIEDAPAAHFMQEFYTAFRSSGRAAQALRIAQLRTRNGPAKAVWSSFVVRANELP